MDITDKMDMYLNEEREGKYFKKGDKVIWKAPDGFTLQGVVVTGDIRGKVKVSYKDAKNKNKKTEVLVPTTTLRRNTYDHSKNKGKPSAAMFHYDTMWR